MKQLTEAQAWREVAQRLDEITGNHDDGFLCIAVGTLEMDGLITRELRQAMRDRVVEHLPPGYTTAYGGITPYIPAEDRVGRLYAALLFAEMAEDEA